MQPVAPMPLSAHVVAHAGRSARLWAAARLRRERTVAVVVNFILGWGC